MGDLYLVTVLKESVALKKKIAIEFASRETIVATTSVMLIETSVLRKENLFPGTVFEYRKEPPASFQLDPLREKGVAGSQHDYFQGERNEKNKYIKICSDTTTE